MIDNNFFGLIDSASRIREWTIESVGQRPEAKEKAKKELAELQMARPIFAFLQALAASEQEALAKNQSQPWPPGHEDLARQALELAARTAAWAGPDGVEGLLAEPARQCSRLWEIALKSRSALLAGGVDLAAVAVGNAKKAMLETVLELVGIDAPARTEEAQGRVDSRVAFADLCALKGAWSAASFEAQLPEALARSLCGDNGPMNFPMDLMAPKMGLGLWAEGQGAILGDAPRGAQEGAAEEGLPQRVAERAREWARSPQRLIFRAAGGGLRGSREDPREQLAADRAVGETFKIVARKMPLPASPAAATACAALLSAKAPTAQSALRLCRKNGAKLAFESGAATPWGMGMESALLELGSRAEHADDEKTSRACAESMQALALWSHEDDFGPAGGSWSVFFAHKALAQLRAELCERHRPKRAASDFVAEGCVRVCEELADAPEMLEEHAVKALAAEFLSAHIEWGDQQAQNEEEELGARQSFGHAAIMGLLSERGGAFEQDHAVWRRLGQCVSRLEAAVGHRPAQGRRKALSL